MADYHPLIARAVAGLEKNTGENRRVLYERARTALVAQLRGVTPPLEESEITRERLALEEAIRKVEAEAARHARETARPTLIKRAELPRREQRPVEPPVSTPREASPPPDVPAGGGGAHTPPEPAVATAPASTPPKPVQPPPASHAAAASTPVATAPAASEPAAPRPAAGTRRSLSDEALKGFRDVVTSPKPATEARRPEGYDHMAPQESPLPEAPSIPAPDSQPPVQYDELEPRLEPEDLWALPPDSRPAAIDFDEARAHVRRPPPAYDEEEPDVETRLPTAAPRRSYRGLIRLALVLIVIGAVGTLAYWQRDMLTDLAGGLTALVRPSAPPPPREAATPAKPKITDRLGQPAPAPAPQAGLPVAQRVVLYEEDPNDPKGKRFPGTVVWRTETKPAAPGRPPELGVRADITVPERKMTVTWSLHRNTDPSLPASHTIEIVFTLPPNSPEGGVQNVPGVLMKQAEQTRGVPLAGLAVKVTPGYFLIGLSALETDVKRNIALLKDRPWFDIPIVYNNNRRAILAMEKGTPGDKVFREAFAAWGE